MPTTGSPWFGLGAGVLLLSAAIGAALVAAALAGDGEGQGDASLFVGGLLRTANRDRLAICVQSVGVDPSMEAKAKTAIEAALVDVAEHPNWSGGVLDIGAPVVDIGCPSGPPKPLIPDYPAPIGQVGGFVVKQASYYHTFVFVLPRAELDRLVGDSTQREANQERFCEDDSCETVTGGLYLAADEIDDPQFLVDRLGQAAGVAPWLDEAGPTNGFLLSENRDRLAICVQAAEVDRSLESVARDNIEAALEGVAEHPYWDAAGFADLPRPFVNVGCPSGPRPIDEAQSVSPIEDVKAENVSQPSLYRIFVFILPPSDLEWLMGSGILRQTAYEYVCSGDSCGEVTTALYIDSDEVADVEALVPILTEAVGLGSFE